MTSCGVPYYSSKYHLYILLRLNAYCITEATYRVVSKLCHSCYVIQNRSVAINLYSYTIVPPSQCLHLNCFDILIKVSWNFLYSKSAVEKRDLRWSNKCTAAMRNICETKHHVPGMTDRIITGSRAAIVNFIQARVALLYHLSTEEARRKK